MHPSTTRRTVTVRLLSFAPNPARKVCSRNHCALLCPVSPSGLPLTDSANLDLYSELGQFFPCKDSVLACVLPMWLSHLRSQSTMEATDVFNFLRDSQVSRQQNFLGADWPESEGGYLITHI